MLQIVKFPNTILRTRCNDWEFKDDQSIEDAKKLEQDMIEAMFAHDGIGLAAPQIGINARAFVMGHRDNPESAQAFFNPVIVAATEDVEDLEEGCLSFPGMFVNIKRPKVIKARWQNSRGEFEEGEFDGYNCKCFLHEYDHLEGIVFQDRVSSLKWAMAVKKINTRKKSKYVRTK
jgi:peptide deformylase